MEHIMEQLPKETNKGNVEDEKILNSLSTLLQY
jgi:hypothetical protein